MIKIALVSLLSVVALFIITKLMGHKQLAQMDFFDYISGITIGSIAAELATELEQPINPLIALAVYGAVSILLSLVTHKLPKMRKYVNGSPTLLMEGGRLYRKNLKQAKLDLSEFMVLCREQGYFDLRDIESAIFEQNGRLSVLPISTKRPVTPADMNFQPKPARINTEVIMDGRIMEENLKRMELDREWLTARLSEQGYSDATEIFLGLCDPDKNLILYPMDPSRQSLSCHL